MHYCRKQEQQDEQFGDDFDVVQTPAAKTEVLVDAYSIQNDIGCSGDRRGCAENRAIGRHDNGQTTPREHHAIRQEFERCKADALLQEAAAAAGQENNTGMRHQGGRFDEANHCNNNNNLSAESRAMDHKDDRKSTAKAPNDPVSVLYQELANDNLKLFLQSARWPSARSEVGIGLRARS